MKFEGLSQPNPVENQELPIKSLEIGKAPVHQENIGVSEADIIARKEADAKKIAELRKQLGLPPQEAPNGKILIPEMPVSPKTAKQPTEMPATKSEQKDFSEERRLIKELEDPITKIINELSEEIERGAYSVILGDDASGRIPTYIINKVINNIYDKKGYQPPLVRYIAGSTGIYQENSDAYTNKKNGIEKQIMRIQKDAKENRREGGKVLIVTDTISTGTSIGMLVDACKEAGIEADVATIGMERPEDKVKMQQSWGGNLVYGMQGTPQIYAKDNNNSIFGFLLPSRKRIKERKEIAKQLSGVTKDRKDIFAGRLKDNPGLNSGKVQERVNIGRQMASESAEMIFQNYFSNKQNRDRINS